MFLLESMYLWCLLFLITSLVFVFPHICDKNSKFRYYYCYIAGVGFCCTILTALFPYFLMQPRNVLNLRIAAEIMKHVDKITLISWEIRNGHILAEDRGAVICCNHQSLFDITGMFRMWGLMRKCTLLAKKELLYYIPFGPIAWLMGIIFINRQVSTEAMKQMQGVSEAIRNDKIKLLVYPEGTRNKDGGRLLPFKSGAFRAAIECQVPIIPIVYSPYYFIDDRKKRFHRGKIVMYVLDPIPTMGLNLGDLNNLRENCYNVMAAAYEMLKVEMQGFT